MPKLMSQEEVQKEQKEFREEVQSMIDRYQQRLSEAVENAQEGSADDVGDAPEHADLVQDYRTLLDKLKLLLAKLDRTIQQRDDPSIGGI
jgi:hypothetical protein